MHQCRHLCPRCVRRFACLLCTKNRGRELLAPGIQRSLGLNTGCITTAASLTLTLNRYFQIRDADTLCFEFSGESVDAVRQDVPLRRMKPAADEVTNNVGCRRASGASG